MSETRLIHIDKNESCGNINKGTCTDKCLTMDKMNNENDLNGINNTLLHTKSCTENEINIDLNTLSQEVDAHCSTLSSSKSVSMSDNNLTSLDSALPLQKSLCKHDKIVGKSRRNSLPETNSFDRKDCNDSNTYNESSNHDLLTDIHSISLKLPSLSSDRAKVAPNITDVVKNVHGLFFTLKNACKDKHFGDMIQVTQKNLTAARNGYMSMKHDMLNEGKPTNTQKEILETLNKYTSLNLASEEHTLAYHRRQDKEITNGSHNTLSSNILEGEQKVVEAPSNDSPLMGLECVIVEQKKQLEFLKNTLLERERIQKELEMKNNELSKQLEANVMRYAMSEKQILSMEKQRNIAIENEAKAKEEAIILDRRLKTAISEKFRICDMLNEKNLEFTSAQREINKMKEELYSADVKLKKLQTKLNVEIEAHKETSLLAEKLGQQVAQQEVSLSGTGTANSTPQHSSNTLTDVQIKEIEASTILERHERQRLEEKCKVLLKELEQTKVTLKAAIHHSEELKAQSESSAGEATALRDICNELRTQSAKDCERLAAAQARAARLDTVTGQLQQEQEKCKKLMLELNAEKTARSTAQAEAELSMRREAELLRQAERLTEAGVRLQATCSEAEAKALALSVDNVSLRAAAERDMERVTKAKSEIEAEKKGREGDARALAAAAARHQRTERLALQRVELLEGDLKVMAIKHASTIKELKREMQQWKRKCEKLEASAGEPQKSDKTVERKGSYSSLSSFEGSTTQNLSDSSQPDRQHLIEKVVELQRAGARRSERLEFLEGHSAQLTAELQKKSKLLRSLMASMPAGALAAPASDRAKLEIGKHGGIMASLFTNEVTDNSMSVELSLEITARLQAVLEDTLLKNITLKENIDTLGDEITLLKEELKKRPKK